MNPIVQKLNAYLQAHPFDPGRDDSTTVLEQLLQAYREAHDFDSPEIRAGYRELDPFMNSLPDGDAGLLAVYNLCQAYEGRAFRDGVQYGAHLMQELFGEQAGRA